MDFGHFGDGPRDQQPPQQPPTTSGSANGNTAGASGGGTPAEEQPIFMHTMEHPGVTCDICNQPIRGFRYKCMECVDYDLCTACERKGNHPGHVCMRIAFPEQAGGAFRKFLGSAVQCGGGRRLGGPFGGPGFGGLGFPFEGVHGLHGGRHGHRERPERGCHRRSTAPEHGSARDSDGDSGQDDSKAPNDCPYGLGRKGMKKWAKCMKKMAYQQRRSAEAYAKSAAQAAGASCATAAGLAGAPVPNGERGTDTQQFDFTAAASQIQEFLNAFGIPIDVVELYDNFGNRGQPRTEGESTSPSANPTAQSDVSEPTSTPPANQQNQVPQVPIGFEGTINAPTNLAAHMQQLHLNGNNQGVTATETTVTPAGPSAPLESSSQAQAAVNMDLDADSSGWTLLDTERAPNASPNGVGQIVETGTTNNETSSVNFGLVGPPLAPVMVPNANITAENNGNVPPPTPTGTTPGGRLYPGLQQPQLQQLFSGVTQAMNSMVRNIPIVTNPSGPPSGNVSGPPSGNGPQVMDVRCTTTLNQLLAMGFSNHDGWLSRLVVAKNGELEAVLNALFPVAQ